jgi:signal transduction histidine kinase
MDPPATTVPTFVTYSIANGLASNNVYCVTEDNWGDIYAGTGTGVERIDPTTGRVKHYTSAEGLPLATLISALRDRRGILWFSYSSGLARFTPEPDPAPRPPPILITTISVANSQRAISAIGETEISLPELMPDNNQLQIAFVGLSFASGETLRYQYKLEGSNTDWSVPSQRRSVNFANLAPGSYRFLVRAINSDGIASLAPAAVTFAVLRPIWQRWWFLLLAAFAVALAVFAIDRYRVARLLEVANMRARIATDLHDDIGANLTRIAILSEVARTRHGGSDTSDDRPLATIARISRESVAAMSDIVWAVNPQHDTLLDLVRRMRRHAEDVLSAPGMELRFNAPGGDQSVRFSVDVRRSVFLIFKEAVNNVARHSHCASVSIDLRIEDSRFILEIADDGTGFVLEDAGGGHGLTSMRRRAEGIGGQLQIESHLNAGTKIILTVSRL